MLTRDPVRSQWEKVNNLLPDHPSYQYPDRDLLISLVDLYFDKFNTLFPLLHRPTFVAMLAQDRHMWDPSFGMVLLMVCALGSRFSPDTRVLSHGDTSGLSSGWKFFSQVPMYRQSLLYKATLFDLQYFVVSRWSCVCFQTCADIHILVCRYFSSPISS